jgi:hypothetical protein
MKKFLNTMVFAQIGKDSLPIVPERRVSDIMSEGNGFNQVFIQSEKATNGPGNFGDQLDMQNPVGNMIILDKIKDLGFINITGIRKRMQDTVRVDRKVLPVALNNLVICYPSDSLAAQTGPLRKPVFFHFIESGFYAKQFFSGFHFPKTSKINDIKEIAVS